MYPDFKELLSAFNAHSVKHLVVGAYAVSIHAQPRATKDLDILVKADIDNANAAYAAALAQFGAPLEGFTFADFAVPGSFFRMGLSRWQWIFFRRSAVSNSMQHGNDVSKMLLTPLPA